MTKLYFSVTGILTIKLESDSLLTFNPEQLLLLQAYVPGILPLELEPEKLDLIITHHETSEQRFNQTTLEFFDQWNGKLPDYFYHVLQGLVRLKLLEQKIYSVHGACAGKNGQVLILGHTGSGKTSVVLEMLKKSETKLISGNKTLVSFSPGLAVLAGTETITVRGKDILKLQGIEIAEQTEYWQRRIFRLPKSTYQIAPAKIEAIALIKLNDYSEVFDTLPPNEAIFQVYPFFLDTVNADVIINSENILIGTPPLGAQQNLTKELYTNLQTLPVYSLIGSAQFVAYKLLNI